MVQAHNTCCSSEKNNLKIICWFMFRSTFLLTNQKNRKKLWIWVINRFCWHVNFRLTNLHSYWGSIFFFRTSIFWIVSASFSAILFSMISTLCNTVEWCLLPSLLPISARGLVVSSRHIYIQIWRGYAILLLLLLERISLTVMPKWSATVSNI